MAIPRGTEFETQTSRGKKHSRSARLKEVIRLLKQFEVDGADRTVRELKAAVDLWAQRDRKEFRNVNSLGQHNAAYVVYFEVTAEYYRRGFNLRAADGHKRVVFIPFAAPANQEFVNKSNQWNSETGNRFDIVSYDGANDGTRRGTVQHDLSSMTDGHVFIRAHGSPGATHVSTRNGADTTTASVEDVCRRLIECGLPNSFSGAIHFYCCYSGVDGRPEDVKRKYKDKDFVTRTRQRPELQFDTGCIARRGAAFLKKKGYRSCRFYGYLGPLKAEYGTRPGGGDDAQPNQEDGRSHRFVVMSEQGRVNAQGYSLDVWNRAYRARVGRREFT